MRIAPGLLALSLALTPIAAATVPADAAAATPKRTVPRLVGAVTPGNAARYTTFIADRLDQVVALRLSVTPGSDGDFKASNYLAQVSGDLFMVFKRAGATEGGIEVVLPKGEARLVGGAYVVEGFFVVRSGGMHQGTLSYGLERMDPRIATAGGAVVRDMPVGP
ncbi:hypothetical protein [Caulobacter sp. NIBR1757]|uniref:hypothetical protein n=1 Tax=Caulobacter sp. NIBR1757 TaxID=3016000 RepID=UPI0022F02807|nr:hypothetical protein [Caulobacter sp. NIBR1757]